LAAFRNDQYAASLKKVKALLEVPKQACLDMLEQKRVAAGFERAIGNLSAEGRSPESIAEVLGISLEQVQKVVNWQQFLSMATKAGLIK
jgi:hypothetical protein